MKPFSHLVIASAVAASLAAPALAQQSSTTDPTRGTAPRDGSGMPQGSPTQPAQHPRPIGDQGATTPSDRMSNPGHPRSSMSHSGMYGEDTVRSAQRALQNKGYDVGAVDGVMGPRTEAAIREFQQRERLNTSGQLDARTLSALNVADAGSTRSGTLSERVRSNRGAGASGAPGSDPGTTGGPAGATGSGSGTAPGAAAGGNTGSSTSRTPGSTSGTTNPNPSSAGRTPNMPSSDPGNAQPGGNPNRGG